MNPFENIDAVLFDLDGTLVETDIDFSLMRREMWALAERHGISTDEVQGLDILAIIDFVVARLNNAQIRQEAFQILEKIEMNHCRQAKLVPHAIELLEAIRLAGMKTGIVTRNCRNAVQISMALTGITADVLLTRDDVPDTKPHPDHLLKALEMLNVRPENAIMVGDHRMDIQGGKAAGMKTVGFLRPGRPEDFFEPARPDIVIRDLGELLTRLRR